jgi:endo-1,4-beta-xylanase
VAHQVDPAAELVIDEYDMECVGEAYRARRQALLALIRDLLARDIQLHGVRLLGHIQGKHQID